MVRFSHHKTFFLTIVIFFTILVTIWGIVSSSGNNETENLDLYSPSPSANDVTLDPFMKKLVSAAKERVKAKVVYDAKYVSIPYPNGDVPENTGVCTDEIIRVYRKVGIDLQKEVHEDMSAHFNQYPKIWGLKKPDTNIDHRRVQNLMTYFTHKKAQLPITRNSEDYKPGDIVTWNFGPGHIGIVTDIRNEQSGNFMILHNSGRGPQIEDVLFQWEITGHYRYY